MRITNGKIILDEPESIKVPGMKYTSFLCDGMEVVINNLTILRLYDILSIEVKKQGYTMEQLVEELKNEKKSYN